ncbi:UrcA family protein [Novosphingobium album (ex Hu et al. 2023)]|uniref:UrcA family protein n=1 Tax=Novosphingobium album (ex Hu et al. 2023) TaxID=2930093 RepID=A0ABT0B5Y7_9SPHN|nr:UrcA family protein [Novosphingobium album (ex Hu et al. 2023)]MCJ2180286.1 UrcA family protein [Novosphingobium album (ex Hu et al. 2023)]
MIKPAIILLAAITAFAGLAPTQAMSRIQRTAVVKYTDLDLQKASQVAVLNRRLQDAVSKVCGKLGMPGPKGFNDWYRCVSEARQTADTGRELALANAHTPKRSVIIEQ